MCTFVASGGEFYRRSVNRLRHQLCRAVSGFVAAWLLCTGAGAVQSPERGRAALDGALERLGGRERVQAVAHWIIDGRGRENLSADLQGLAPGRPTWRDHEEQIAVDARGLAVAWERKSARNDMSLRWRRLILNASNSRFVDWVSGQAGGTTAPPAESRRRALARRVPHLLLLEASRAEGVRWKAERLVRGIVLDVVEVALPDAGRLDLMLPRQGAPISGVEFQTLLPGAGEVTVAWEWHGWRPDAGLGLIPSGHRITIGRVPFHDVTYTRFAASGDMPTLLAEPDAGPTQTRAAAPPAALLPATGEVSPGVFVASVGGFAAMYVEFDDFVVALEAPAAHPGFEGIPAQPGSTRPSEEWLALITARVPAKPIRYLVLSHHHSDHLGGVAPFAAAGATLLVPPGDRAAALRAAGGKARVETIAARRTISDGKRSLEIFNVRGNPHTAENLAAWLPRERIVFQGDLYYYAAGMPFPPSGRDIMNRFFARWLRDRGLAPVAVYGVHNSGAAGPEALAMSAR